MEKESPKAGHPAVACCLFLLVNLNGLLLLVLVVQDVLVLVLKGLSPFPSGHPLVPPSGYPLRLNIVKFCSN